MRVLFVTNYYPPSALGGYEMWCQEVAQSLTARGHRVVVLTSDDGTASAIEDGVEVRRVLDLEVRGGTLSTLQRAASRQARSQANVEALNDIVNELRPDAALMWGMWNLPRETARAAEAQLGRRAVYYFCDYWTTLPTSYLQQLSAPARTLLGRIAKKAAVFPVLHGLRSDAAVELELAHPVCTSHAVKEILLRQGVKIPHAEVIHGGICTKRFRPETKRAVSDRLRMLYLGRITADKGVQTAVEAMRIVAAAGANATLDVYGRGEADFVEGLKSEVARNGSSKHVSFRGSVTSASTPALLRSYDALLFPSEWDEPFARSILEGMASGLAVIGTTTGGTGEILKDGETGLTFQAGDERSLARAILQLAAKPELAAKLGATAREVVVGGYDLSRMVDELEAKLTAVVTLGGDSPQSSDKTTALPADAAKPRAQIRVALI